MGHFVLGKGKFRALYSTSKPEFNCSSIPTEGASVALSSQLLKTVYNSTGIFRLCPFT